MPDRDQPLDDGGKLASREALDGSPREAASAELTPISVKMLVLADGNCPFEDWYRGIKDSQTRSRIRTRVIQMQRGLIGSGRHLGGIAEMKLDFGPGYRIYFVKQGNTIVILVGGGDKSSQSEDIKRARKHWKDNENAPERFQRDF